MLKPRRPRRATPMSIGKAIGTLDVKSIHTHHVNKDKLWLIEQHEPFYEILIADNGERLICRASVHCAPQWAGIVTAKLFETCDKVQVLAEPFIQDARGSVRYGIQAEAYWKTQQDLRPLLTARFVGPAS